jgi:hypothetical protein
VTLQGWVQTSDPAKEFILSSCVMAPGFASACSDEKMLPASILKMQANFPWRARAASGTVIKR